MKISSPAFNDGDDIPVQYTCEGMNVNPPLQFSDVPSDAKSLVLLMEDPDAKAKPWVHWILYNIPPQTNRIDENSFPRGAEPGIGNGRSLDYEGPCPPGERHVYIFKLYALDDSLYLSEGPDRNAVLAAMQGHIMDQAELKGYFERR